MLLIMSLSMYRPRTDTHTTHEPHVLTLSNTYADRRQTGLNHRTLNKIKDIMA